MIAELSVSSTSGVRSEVLLQDDESSEVEDQMSAHDFEEPVYYTARHLLAALQKLDSSLLDLPLVLIHGKELQKPRLVQGLLPSPTPVNRKAVESKQTSLLTLGMMKDSVISGQTIRDP